MEETNLLLQGILRKRGRKAAPAPNRGGGQVKVQEGKTTRKDTIRFGKDSLQRRPEALRREKGLSLFQNEETTTKRGAKEGHKGTSLGKHLGRPGDEKGRVA